MIVEHSDLIRDLKYWETLSVSQMMLRPVRLLHGIPQTNFYADGRYLERRLVQKGF